MNNHRKKRFEFSAMRLLFIAYCVFPICSLTKSCLSACTMEVKALSCGEAAEKGPSARERRTWPARAEPPPISEAREGTAGRKEPANDEQSAFPIGLRLKQGCLHARRHVLRRLGDGQGARDRQALRGLSHRSQKKTTSSLAFVPWKPPGHNSCYR